MKLYIKRDKIVNDSLFIIFDQLCNERYYVTGSKDKLEVKNTENQRCMTIRRMLLPAVNGYSISSGKNNIKFIIGNRKNNPCYFHGIGWQLRGNVFTKSFDIINADNSLVASHSKEFSKCGDGYALCIYEEPLELFCIGTALCINLESKVDNPQLQTV